MPFVDRIIAKEANAVGRLAAKEASSLSQLGESERVMNRNIGLESAGFAVAEVTSMLTALGIVAVADRLAPNTIKHATNALSKAFVQPLLDPIEAALDKVCKLEECKRDKDISREERACQLAKTLVVFGASWAGSMAAKIETRRYMNRSFGIAMDVRQDAKWWQFWKLTKREKIILSADELVHYGGLIVANMGAPKLTDDIIRSTQNVLVQCGVPEDKAHELAAYGMIWEAPNLAGLLAGLGAIYATHKYPARFGLTPHA